VTASQQENVEDILTPVMHTIARELAVLIDNDEAQLDR